MNAVMIDNISTYKNKSHPLIQFDTACQECSLGKNNKLSHTKAVRGSGPDDLSKVKLIVISDHTGYYERLHKYAFFDNQLSTKPEDKAEWLNAGALLRRSLNKLFNLDTYTDCWMTNVIKCEPGHNTISSDHLKVCSKHLVNELQYLDIYCPTAPILIAGNKAFKSFKSLVPGVINEKSTLQELRRRSDLYYKHHHLCFTMNPAAISKCEFRVEKEVYYYNNDTFVADYQSYPILVGSPLYHWCQDLLIIKDDILNHNSL